MKLTIYVDPVLTATDYLLIIVTETIFKWEKFRSW
jgi:hypothetical protein